MNNIGISRTDQDDISIAVVLINWNGKADSLACLKALQGQTLDHLIIVVDNGSSDGFVDIVKSNFPEVVLVENSKNLGFAGGANSGIRHAMGLGMQNVALINNDALPDRNWLEHLVHALKTSPNVGIVASLLVKPDGTIDSAGQAHSRWGLSYPVGRDMTPKGDLLAPRQVFAASGGAMLARVALLKQIGLFDEDFFAYYEDIDLCYRAQLAGWKIAYAPDSKVVHKLGQTSGKLAGFTDYQTVKNLPWLFWKNTPTRLLPATIPRFLAVYVLTLGSMVLQAKFLPVLKGLLVSTALMPKKIVERLTIQRNRKVEPGYISSILDDDLPPSANRLRRLLTPRS